MKFLVALALIAGFLGVPAVAGAATPPGLVATGAAPASCAAAPAGEVSCYARLGRSMAQVGRGTRRPADAAPFTGAEIADLYGLRGFGSTRTIAIVDVGSDPNVASLMATFRSANGLPACPVGSCFREVGQTGGTKLPAFDSSWSVEINLDVQAASATCPTCHILLVDANDAQVESMDAAVRTAAALGADVVSMSWGSSLADDPDSASDATVYASGPLYVAATGDWGYHASGGGDCSTPTVAGSDDCASYPAAFPNVVAVGGTSVVVTSTGYDVSGWSGAGSGCSAGVARPWQAAVATGCAGRAVADVSALADPLTGLTVYLADSGGAPVESVVGGTSLAAPIVAAMFLLAGNTTQPQAPYLNAAADPSLVRDVTTGDPSGECSPLRLCQPMLGWDGQTGLGTPVSPALFATSAARVPSSPPPPDSAAPTPAAATTVRVRTGQLRHTKRARVMVSVIGGTPAGTVVVYDGTRRVGAAAVTPLNHAGLAVLLRRLAKGRHRLRVVFTPSVTTVTGSSVAVTARVR